ncbi:DNA-binding protein [Facklamia sp. P12937]|uniref:DNA-binding protein n=1 Tax=Facklamia sp. P12937 TaxID=3421949 RepID=UPI003D16438C
MNEISALLSEEASLLLVDGILKLAERIAEEKIAQQKKQWLMQKEVFEEYECCARDVAHWETLGLKKRRLGKRWLYDRNDIDELLQTLKE